MFRFLFFFLVCSFVFSQQVDRVDFTVCKASVVPNATTKSIKGIVNYEFTVLKPIDTIFIDAVTMNFNQVMLNDKEASYVNTGKKIGFYNGFTIGKNTLTFQYEAIPKQTLYFVGEKDDLQIWTQGQGKYTSHWLPSFDDVNEKVVFNLSVSYQKDFQALANGTLKNTSLINPNTIKWEYNMEKPMSSYLVMLAIGKFEKQTEKTNSGTVLEYYLDRKDIDKFETTYRYSKQLFDFLEKEIQIKFPWKIYKQVPVKDFLYAGMENTTATVFSQEFVVDSIGFNDKNYVNVNAHELAHQWFGDLITAKESKHHWLQEGFATYYALLAEKEIFGEDYFYNELYESALLIETASKNDSIPILNANASSLTFYKKGAWALHILRTDIGTKKFNKAVKLYLEKYAYKNVATSDFLNIIKKVSGYDVAKFQKKWLESSQFTLQEVLPYLEKNKSIQKLLVFNNSEFPQETIFESYVGILNSDVYDALKQEVVYNYLEIPQNKQIEFLKLALATNNLKVRQAVAEVLNRIPLELKKEFETLLQDKSYVTREIALFRLYTNFKEDRTHYLELAKSWESANINLKIALITLEIVEAKNAPTKKVALHKLESYMQLPNDATTREMALETAFQLEITNETVIKELINATLHHKWQFVKYGKEKLRLLLNNPTHNDLFSKLELNEVQKNRFSDLKESLLVK